MCFEWNFVIQIEIMTKHIKTTIEIKASPEKVWSILTDYKKYPEWNPFINSIAGEVKEGMQIHVKIQNMSFKPTVLVYQQNSELKWLGHLLVKGLFDGEHRFLLTDNGNGTTTFEHSETFDGILVGAFSKKLDKETRPGFIAMNDKLKELAERI